MNLTELDRHSDICEARLEAGLTVNQCLNLCAVSQRTWYRWIAHGAPRWAIRLISSQLGTLDRFGWKDWEIRSGLLYCNALHHRYHWEPVNLLLPLYGVRDTTAPLTSHTDNVTSIASAKLRRAATYKENYHECHRDDLLP